MNNSIQLRSAYFWYQVVKLIKKKNFQQVDHWLEKFYEARVRDK